MVIHAVVQHGRLHRAAAIHLHGCIHGVAAVQRVVHVVRRITVVHETLITSTELLLLLLLLRDERIRVCLVTVLLRK